MRLRVQRMLGWAATVGVAGLAGVMVLGGATSASAATVGHWGTFTVSGSARAYTGTMSLPGFPATDFTSTSRQASVISGASVWQGPQSGPGAVYGSSRDNTYLNQRPMADNANPASAARTVYSFGTPTPAGGWSFVLGDIDADQATISATDVDGNEVSAAQLGFQSTYNSCSSVSPGGWSCGKPTADDPNPGSDQPTWNPATHTVTGNASASDTSGASIWFSPTVPLKTLTIVYLQRSGFPVYQTWFADTTAAISGTATIDGVPYPGATVTATDTAGNVVRTTTAADGTYSFPTLVRSTAAYTVAITPPPGATGSASSQASVASGDASADFTFTAPPGQTTVIGTVTTVVDGETVPAADVPVTVGATDTTTNESGTYVVSNLPPSTSVPVTVAGEPQPPVTTGTADAPPTPVPPVTVAPTDVAVVSGTATLDDAPYAGATVTLTDGTGNVVATVTTAADGSYAFPTVTAPDAYTVTIVPPAAATGTSTATVDVTPGSDAVVPPFTFTSEPTVPTSSVSGTITDTAGNPVAGAEVTATPTAAPDDVVSTVSGDDGSFTLEGLTPGTEYALAANGTTFATVTPTAGSSDLGTVAVPGTGGVTPPPTSTPTPTPTPSPSSTVAPVSDPGAGTGSGALAFTGSNPTPALIGAGILVLIGAVFLVARAIRGQRDHHLED